MTTRATYGVCALQHAAQLHASLSPSKAGLAARQGQRERPLLPLADPPGCQRQRWHLVQRMRLHRVAQTPAACCREHTSLCIVRCTTPRAGSNEGRPPPNGASAALATRARARLRVGACSERAPPSIDGGRTRHNRRTCSHPCSSTAASVGVEGGAVVVRGGNEATCWAVCQAPRGVLIDARNVIIRCRGLGVRQVKVDDLGGGGGDGPHRKRGSVSRVLKTTPGRA